MLMMMFNPSNSIIMLNFFFTLSLPVITTKIFKKNFFFKIIQINLMNEFKKNSIMNYKMMKKMTMSLFFLIFFLNMANLFPYLFISSAHLSTNLLINFSMWMSMMLLTLLTSTFLKNFFIKLTPISTPNFLMPFMVLIELISLLMRPFTLILRLTANMIAGHILMFLVSSAVMSNFFFYIPLFILSLLELSMSFLQAYILFTLICLYFNDIK